MNSEAMTNSVEATQDKEKRQAFCLQAFCFLCRRDTVPFSLGIYSVAPFSMASGMHISCLTQLMYLTQPIAALAVR